MGYITHPQLSVPYTSKTFYPNHKVLTGYLNDMLHNGKFGKYLPGAIHHLEHGSVGIVKQSVSILNIVELSKGDYTDYFK